MGEDGSVQSSLAGFDIKPASLGDILDVGA
jgi:hypothetical protein